MRLLSRKFPRPPEITPEFWLRHAKNCWWTPWSRPAAGLRALDHTHQW